MPQVGEQVSEESLSNAPFADRKAAVYCKPNVSSPTITSTAHEAATASRLAGKAVSAISSLLYLTSRSTPANGPECHWSRMYEHVDQKIRHLERALKDEITLCREPSKIHTDLRILYVLRSTTSHMSRLESFTGCIWVWYRIVASASFRTSSTSASRRHLLLKSNS